MHRTTVMLTAQQLRGLKEVGQLDHLSMSSLLRIFVTEGISRRKRAQAAQVVLPGKSARRQAILGE
jgi:hypothetical protein